MKDLLIVGGGLMGAALAHHAARLGLSTTLIEAAVVGGAGATAHSRGMVRVYDPDPVLMAWNLRGVAEWASWSLPFPSPFAACGLTYFVAPANRAHALEALARHNHAAYPITVLDGEAAVPARLRHLWCAGGLVLYEPRAGYVDTRLAARLFAESARRLGAVLLEGSPVLGIAEGGGAAEVRLAHASLHARQVVLAAGAGTPALADAGGLFSRSIPLSCVVQDPLHPLAECLIDEVSGAYARPHGADFFYCGGAPQDDAPMPELLVHDAGAGACNLRLARHLWPAGTRGVLDTHRGHDAYTAALLPRLDRCPGFQRIRFATGFSGRGAKYIPAVARTLATGLATELDAELATGRAARCVA
jgi:glycine/D-amino acid oxidase-like deaminating enzyme